MKNYIVFDLEWNQSPQGKEKSIEELPFEIIEIGAVKLDENLCTLSEFHKLISPKVYNQMHFKITEVTHMSMEELREAGESFEMVIEAFIRWCGEDFVFCTWGSMDLMELQRNMKYFQIDPPFGKPLFYYDIQKLYARLYGDKAEKPSLDTAVEALGISEDRPFHRALDDAYYTGKVMGVMDFEAVRPYFSVDYYQLPVSREEEIHLEFPDYSKYVSRPFQTKEEALEDKTVTDMVCGTCNRMLRKKVRWFSYNQKIYFCLACCPKHGYVRGKIRMKKADDGKIYVVKTMKLVDDESAQRVCERKEELRQRRNEKSKIKRAEKRNTSSSA